MQKTEKLCEEWQLLDIFINICFQPDSIQSRYGNGNDRCVVWNWMVSYLAWSWKQHWESTDDTLTVLQWNRQRWNGHWSW